MVAEKSACQACGTSSRPRRKTVYTLYKVEYKLNELRRKASLIMANEKQSLVDELKSLLEQNVTEVKDKVEALKTQFYRQYHEEQAALKKAAEEAAAKAGEVLENWQPTLDEAEQQFRALLNEYKTKRAEVSKQIEEEQAQNLLKFPNKLKRNRHKTCCAKRISWSR